MDAASVGKDMSAKRNFPAAERSERVARVTLLTRHRVAAELALSCALAGFPSSAHAQAPNDAIDRAPTPFRDDAPELQARDRERLEERTAYTIGAGRLKLGLLTFEYGISERLAVGIDPPAWAARAVLPIWVPNAHAEWTAFQRPGLALSIEVGGYFADLRGAEGAGGTLVAVPISVFASKRLLPRWWLHGEATYILAEASGTGDLDNTDLEGSVATRAGQLGALLEYQLSRVVSLTAVGRYQVYSGSLVFRGTSAVDASTTAHIEAQLEPRVPHPWQAIAGAAFLWSNVRLGVGVGYGYYFIPGVNIGLGQQTIVPDLSLAVVL
jgi:hypothetical protein